MRARSSMGMLSRGGDRCWRAGDVVGGVEVGIGAGIEGGEPSWLGARVVSLLILQTFWGKQCTLDSFL